jgi:Mg2+-importing ATPase
MVRSKRWVGMFLRSRPSRPLLLAAFGAVAVGIALPYSPLSSVLGFQPLPNGFFAALTGMGVAYFVLIDFAKRWFFLHLVDRTPTTRQRGHAHRIHRRASRFTYHSPLRRQL